MRRKINTLYLVLLLVGTVISSVLATSYKFKLDKQKVEIYSVKGGNKDFRLTNGLIIIEPDKEVLVGGEIEYLGKRRNNIRIINEKIVFFDNGKRDIVMIDITEGDNEGMVIPDDLSSDVGMISGSLFANANVEIALKNLEYVITCKYINGDIFESRVKLEIKEIGIF